MTCRGAWFGLGALLAAGCSGDGSDIGPRLPRLPDASCKAVVLDDAGRGVVGATVALEGTSVRAVTGRNGRGDLLANPRGRVRLRVDGRAAAAVAADRLPELRFAATIVGQDLPAPVHLPVLSAAAVSVPAGTQTVAAQVLAAGGSSLDVAAGTSVGAAAALPAVELRLGELLPQHLPGDLPGVAGGAVLFGRGVFVDPPDVAFTPPASLDVADELAAGAAPVTLYHLDPDTGEWQTVPVTVIAAGGRLTAASGVAAGGLYAFGAPVAATTVGGRVLDAAGDPVPDAMVRVDQVLAVSAGDGRFSASGVPATAADGGARQCAVEVFAGGAWLPAAAGGSFAVSADPVDVGDLTLDTRYAGNVRVQQIVRARADAKRPARIGSLDGGVELSTLSDANGQIVFEDVPAGFVGFQEGRPFVPGRVLYGQAGAFLQRGRRWLDSYQFLFDRGWYAGSRRTTAYVCGAVGGGPIQGAWVLQGADAGAGLLGTTLQAGTFFVARDFRGRATAVNKSERDGRSIVHAMSIVAPNSDHLEFPLQRLLRAPLGAFDRHGLVRGVVVGADPTRSHELRSTRRITRQEWWDDAVAGMPIRSSLPLDVDPATTHAAFAVGVAAAGGNVCATEFTTDAGQKRLQRAAVLEEFEPVEGGVVDADLPLAFDATLAFVVPDAVSSVDPAVGLAGMEFALALDQGEGRVVDVARGLRGNLTATATDLRFLLPPLTDGLLGRRWLVALQGASTSGGVTSSCAALIELASPSTGGFVFQPLPTLSSPAPDATVAASGFEVAFALPPAATFGTIDLDSDDGTGHLLWHVVVPNTATAFAFVALPPDVATPLVPGREYTLTLSAWYGPVSTGSPDPYPDLVAFAQTIAPIEAGLTQIARRSIRVVAE